MNLQDLSLRDCHYFRVLSQECHFKKASEKLHISQPTLSDQIKKLEQQLGFLLFERQPRALSLTHDGEKFLSLVNSLWVHQEKLQELSAKKAIPLEGAFHLGAIHTIGPYLWPYLLAPLKKKFPQLELIIHEGTTEDLVRGLQQKELNAFIASNTFSDENLRLHSLYEERFLLARPKNVDQKNQKTLRYHDVNLDQLMLLSDGHCFKDEVQNFCRLKEVWTTTKQYSSLETLLFMVAAGNGETFIPELAIRNDHSLSKLIDYIPFQEKKAHREIILVSRESYPYPEEIRLLARFIREYSPLTK